MYLKSVITFLIWLSFLPAVSAGTCGGITHSNITINSSDYGLVPARFVAVCQIKSIGISPGFVEDNLTLTNNVLWVLEGQVDIGRNIINGNENPILDPNGNNAAVLTIMPGTTVVGDQSTAGGSLGLDYLVVHRGSEIHAEGIASEPIHFTSIESVVGNTTAAGQWGGIIINGYANINECNTLLDCENTGLVGEYFGGNDNSDSSGLLAYTIISHAAKKLTPVIAFNGLTLNAVGQQTSFDHIQVHESEGNALSVTGGSAIIQYLALTNNQQDGLYWTGGWTGAAQFVLGIQPTDGGYFAHGENNDNNMLAEPVSFPKITNATVISSSILPVIRLASGTKIDWVNAAIVSTGTCFEHDSPASEDVLISNTYIQCTKVGQSVIEEQWFSNGQFNLVVAEDLINGYVNGEILRSAIGRGNEEPLDYAPYVGAVRSCDFDWLSEWGLFLPVVNIEECIDLSMDVPALSYLSIGTLALMLTAVYRSHSIQIAIKDRPYNG